MKANRELLFLFHSSDAAIKVKLYNIVLPWKERLLNGTKKKIEDKDSVLFVCKVNNSLAFLTYWKDQFEILNCTIFFIFYCKLRQLFSPCVSCLFDTNSVTKLLYSTTVWWRQRPFEGRKVRYTLYGTHEGFTFSQRRWNWNFFSTPCLLPSCLIGSCHNAANMLSYRILSKLLKVCAVIRSGTVCK